MSGLDVSWEAQLWVQDCQKRPVWPVGGLEEPYLFFFRPALTNAIRQAEWDDGGGRALTAVCLDSRVPWFHHDIAWLEWTPTAFKQMHHCIHSVENDFISAIFTFLNPEVLKSAGVYPNIYCIKKYSTLFPHFVMLVARAEGERSTCNKVQTCS